LLSAGKLRAGCLDRYALKSVKEVQQTMGFETKIMIVRADGGAVLVYEDWVLNNIAKRTTESSVAMYVQAD
jgi:hypothetical protein